jgi:multidrug transporter EmrE-like cation transporter
MRPYLLVCCSLVVFSIGEYLSKIWANNPRWWLAILVPATYACGSVFWLPAIREHNHLTSLGTIWNLGAMMATIAVGALLFSEPVTSRQWAGIVLALLACCLIS